MKLFQIEEPEGAPHSAEGPGAAVGIDVAEAGGAVAVSVGGNAEILPGVDGERRLVAERLRGADGRLDAAVLATLLLALRGRAEKQLQRPVTHAVIAAEPLDPEARRLIEATAEAAGLVALRLLDRATAAARAATAPREDRAVLGAAALAEDLAPPAG